MATKRARRAADAHEEATDLWDDWHRYEPEEDHEEADRTQAEFEEARERWPLAHHPELVWRGPEHSCFVTYPCSGQRTVVFEELDRSGTVCGARLLGGRDFGFGSPAEATARATARSTTDGWIKAVAEALTRERALRQRRRFLQVGSADREFVHVTAVTNRQSIRRHGLDWRRMGTYGIAGSTRPELEGVFLDWDEESAGFFTRMSRLPSDVWGVQAKGLWLENGRDGWWIVPQPIPPERLRLIKTDIPAGHYR